MKLLIAISVCCALLLLVPLEKKSTAFVPFMNSGGSPYTWDLAGLPNRTVYWKIQDGAPMLARESVLFATSTWTQATGGQIQFAEGEGGIQVDWDTTGTEIFDTLFLAYTSFTTTGNSHISHATVIVNAASYTWQRGGYGGVGPMINGKREANLDSVLLHEFGHALGLDHSDRDSTKIVGSWGTNDLPTMNSIIYPGAETLHVDDQTGIQSIYQVSPGAVSEPQLLISASRTQCKRNMKVAFAQIGGDDSTRWDFGDGVNGYGSRTLHAYKKLGSYKVTATCNGESASVTIEVVKKLKWK